MKKAAALVVLIGSLVLLRANETPWLKLGEPGLHVSPVSAATPTPTPQSLTNTQKLSLSPSTPVGTQVSVSDGFVVSGVNTGPLDFPPNGLFASLNVTVNGKPSYEAKFPTDNATTLHYFFFYSTDQVAWIFSDAATEGLGDEIAAVTGNENFPWLATWTDQGFDGNPSFVPPPILQQLATPDTTLNGVFVDTVGLFQEAGMNSGKSYYQQINTSINAGPLDRAISNDGSRWDRFNSSSSQEHTSNNPSKPWDGTGWTNVFTPVSLTSRNGLTRGGVTYYVPAGIDHLQNNRFLYRDLAGVAPDIAWDGTKWTDGTHNGSGNTAFPDIGTEDPVASEANWSVVP